MTKEINNIDKLTKLIMEMSSYDAYRLDPNDPDNKDEIARQGSYLTRMEQLIKEEKIDVNGVNSYGDTPLHTAALCLSEGAVKLLLKHGAKADILTVKGQIPLENLTEAMDKSLESNSNVIYDFGQSESIAKLMVEKLELNKLKGEPKVLNSLQQCLKNLTSVNSQIAESRIGEFERNIIMRKTQDTQLLIIPIEASLKSKTFIDRILDVFKTIFNKIAQLFTTSSTVKNADIKQAYQNNKKAETNKLDHFPSSPPHRPQGKNDQNPHTK